MTRTHVDGVTPKDTNCRHLDLIYKILYVEPESDVGMESYGEGNVLLHAGLYYGLYCVLLSYVGILTTSTSEI